MTKKIYKIPIYRLQLVRDGHIETRTICNTMDIFKAIKTFVRSDREIFVDLYLNARNQVIVHHIISVGTVNTSLVHPREVFKPAILKNACSVIVAHNHPSGCSEPSTADRQITTRLKDALALIDVRVLDHFVVSRSSYVSLAERGWL